MQVKLNIKIFRTPLYSKDEEKANQLMSELILRNNATAAEIMAEIGHLQYSDTLYPRFQKDITIRKLWTSDTITIEEYDALSEEDKEMYTFSVPNELPINRKLEEELKQIPKTLPSNRRELEQRVADEANAFLEENPLKNGVIFFNGFQCKEVWEPFLKKNSICIYFVNQNAACSSEYDPTFTGERRCFGRHIKKN